LSKRWILLWFVALARICSVIALSNAFFLLLLFVTTTNTESNVSFIINSMPPKRCRNAKKVAFVIADDEVDLIQNDQAPILADRVIENNVEQQQQPSIPENAAQTNTNNSSSSISKPDAMRQLTDEI